MTVEVFKTDVNKAELAEKIIGQVLDYFPDSRVNFDLDDCDNILRVEAKTVIPEKIIEILNLNGYSCKVLI